MNLEREIETIINSNCKEIPYEGTDVNKGQLKYDIKEFTIEFTKLKVIEALKVASEKAKMYDANEDCDYVDEAGNCPEDYRIDRNSILNAYSLDLIK